MTTGQTNSENGMARSLATLVEDHSRQVMDQAKVVAENGLPDKPGDEEVFGNMVQDLIKMRDTLKRIQTTQTESKVFKESLE